MRINIQRFVFVLAVLFLVCCKPDGGNAKPPIMSRDTVTIERADGTEFIFYVELALSDRHQRYGLMNRTSMPDNAGMLFVFDDVEKRSFWMKNTRIPLDLIFIAEDGRIKHIHHNARPMDESTITSHYPAKAVLEINGGGADSYGIEEGDVIRYKYFNNTLN